MAERIRILIVDDHPAIRKGLVATLEPELDMEVVGTATTRQQAVESWRRTRPDITLMDLALENGGGGVEAIRQIRQEFPCAKIIVFSALTGDEDVYQALHSGAVTYLTKGTPDEELVQTVREVHAGGRPVPPEIARKLADRVSQSNLTAREIEVLDLVAKGFSQQGDCFVSLHQRRNRTESHEAHSVQVESQRSHQGSGRRFATRNHSAPLRHP
jgi:two-component system NarL family response regulator